VLAKLSREIARIAYIGAEVAKFRKIVQDASIKPE
jgi:hypothetical protein